MNSNYNISLTKKILTLIEKLINQVILKILKNYANIRFY